MPYQSSDLTAGALRVWIGDRNAGKIETQCYSRSYMVRASIFRLVAVFLLLLTSAELYACEVLAPEQCESFGYPQDGNPQRSDDNCICCCSHVMVVQPVLLDASVLVITSVAPVEHRQVEQQPASIYHPPKA